MRVAVKRTAGEWFVIALEGEFAGNLIARTDGIVLNDVQFELDTIEGDAQAVWGCVMEEKVSGAASVCKGLGVGRPFQSKHDGHLRFDGRQYTTPDCFVVGSAERVQCLGRDVFVTGVRIAGS